MRFNPWSLFRAAVCLAAVAPGTLGLAVDKPQTRADNDPFYQPPAGFESKAPGTVLASRRIIASFFTFIPDPIEAYQILYRTTAIDGSATATVTTVFKPLFAKKDRFITYNNAYDSASPKCSPSRAYRLGSDPVDAIASFEFLAIQLYLLSGYIVSAPDYEGPEAAFSPGLLSAMGVLDSMRAVQNFRSKLGLSDKAMVAGVGYSGGGLATGWAAALHPAYAPEVPVKAWMAGGIPADLQAILEFIDGTVTSGFAPIAIAGMLKPTAYGAKLKPVFDKIATPYGQKAIALAGDQCVEVPLIAYPFQSVLGTKFQTLGRGLLTEPTVAEILKRNRLGVNKTETPIAPVMMYHAENDEIVPYPPVVALDDAWCSNGATVKFTNYAAGGHGTTAALAFIDAINFAKDAFAGKIAPGCTKRTVLDEQLNPLALGLQLEPFVVGLINWIAAMGKQDKNWLEAIKNGKHLF